MYYFYNGQKNDLHIRVPAGFFWSGWVTTGGRTRLSPKADEGV